MKKYALLLGFFLATFHLFSQYPYKFGYWENNDWKKYLKHTQNTDSFEIRYPNGNIRYKGYFKNELPDSIWSYFDKEGRIVVKSNYNGLFERFDHTDSVIERGFYKNGFPYGKWLNRFYIYSRSGNDFLELNDVYDFDTEKLHLVSSGTDSIKHFSKKKFFNKRKLQNYYSSFGVGFNNNYHIIDDFNSFINNNINQNFDSFNKLRFIELTWRAPSSVYASLNFHTVSNDYIKLDTMNLAIRYNGASFINLGYDLVKAEWIDIVPMAGLGVEEVELIIEKDNPEPITPVNIFNYTPHTNYIQYRSSPLSANIELITRINIPLGKFTHWGVYIGNRMGYMGALNNVWKDQEQNKLDQIPKVKFSKLRITFNFGLFLFE